MHVLQVCKEFEEGQIIWDVGNLGVSSEPGRLLPEAGVPDLEPPPRPLEGGNLPPFLGVYIRSETFLVLILATSKESSRS